MIAGSLGTRPASEVLDKERVRRGQGAKLFGTNRVWPPETGLQGQDPNHPMPLRPQGVVVFRRDEPITGLAVERGNLSWGVVDEVFRGAVGKVSSGPNHEGKSQDPCQGRSNSS